MTAILLHLIPNSVGRWQIGSLASPMFPHIASRADDTRPYAGPEYTTDGIVCGRCTDAWTQSGSPCTARHASVEHVKACERSYQYCLDEAAAEEPLRRAGWL